MARYALNLPTALKDEAESRAAQQGISLNQFILWAVADHVSALRSSLDDPEFNGVTYRRSASGQPVPVLRRTGIRVKTVVVAAQTWGLDGERLAEELDLSLDDVTQALRFYERHRSEIDAAIADDERAPGTVPPR